MLKTEDSRGIIKRKLRRKYYERTAAYDSGLMETVNTDALSGVVEAVEKAV